MSKVLSAVGAVAGLVSAVARFVPGGQLVSAIAAGVSIAASIAAPMAAKKPVAKGQLQSRLFGANMPLPYPMGRTYVVGRQVHEAGWGGKVGKVQNPYKFIAVVYSCAGPVQSIDDILFDYASVGFSGSAATGYYGGFLWKDVQLGASPEADALAPHWSSCPGWGADYKLSGYAAAGFSFLFDKDGKVFASGIPQFGVVGHWVKTYDARQDSTFPGGSGAHRITNEATWAWSESPAQHAVAYAYGRSQNGKMIFGPGLEATGIDLGTAVAWDNVCDANNWTIGGEIVEPGDAWNNLKLICQAGGAEPVIGTDGILTFKYQAPRVSLARIKRIHIKGDDVDIAAGKSFRDRPNIIVPKFRSEANQWTYVQGTEQRVDDFVTADGEEIEAERQYDLVQVADQSAELALYEIYQAREPGPFSIPLGPEFQDYLPGDTLTLDEDCELWREEIDVVVTKREVDVLSGLVTFEFEGETPAKHVAVLGASATAPAAVTIPTGEERDGAIGGNLETGGSRRFVSMTPPYPASSGDGSISTFAFSGVLNDGRTISCPEAIPAVTGLTNDSWYMFFWNMVDEEYVAVLEPAIDEMASTNYAFIGRFGISTGGTYPPPSGEPPPGWGGTGPSFDGPIP